MTFQSVRKHLKYRRGCFEEKAFYPQSHETLKHRRRGDEAAKAVCSPPGIATRYCIRAKEYDRSIITSG